MALVGETIAEEALFSVHATGPSTRQRRTLKHGDSFAVLDSHGDMGAVADVADGLFHCDTRFLSRLELRLNGIAPLLLGSNVSDDNSTLNVDLTNPDILIGERLLCKKDTLHIVRTLFVWRGRFYQRLGVRNHGEEEINFELSFIFASDFADIFEVRGLERERHGTTSIGLKSPGKVVLRYAGLDDKIRQTSIGLDPDPTLLGPNVALYRLSLAPKARTSIFVEVCCDQPKETQAARLFPCDVRGQARFEARNLPGGVGSNLERHIQRGAVPVGRRSLHAHDGHTGGALSLRRDPLVFHDLRTRRSDHCLGDVVDRPEHRSWCPAPAGCIPGNFDRSVRRFTTRKNSP